MLNEMRKLLVKSQKYIKRQREIDVVIIRYKDHLQKMIDVQGQQSNHVVDYYFFKLTGVYPVNVQTE